MANESAEAWNVVGHEWAVGFLQRVLKRHSLSHAYLFVGPAQVGKRTLGTEFARAISCQRPPGPCGVCRSCQLVQRGVHPDISTIRGEGSKGAILVDQVRSLRREANLSPVEGTRRIYIICGMESANESASNALLKTLEEPPAHVVFLLTSTSDDMVSPTIVSRCQVLPLRQLSRETIRRALQDRWSIQAERASLLASLSGGRFGMALSLLQSEVRLQSRGEALDRLQTILGGGISERFDGAAEIARRPEQVQDTLEVWLSWWRDILLMQQGLSGQIANQDRQHQLLMDSTAFRTDQVCGALSSLQTCSDHLQKNIGPRLALERLMWHLPTREVQT